jgi:gas vesicle protein
MRKLLLGAIIGGALVYFMDPEQGSARRARFTGRWADQKDSVLEVARQAGSAVGTASQGVTELVGQAKAASSNGAEGDSAS